MSLDFTRRKAVKSATLLALGGAFGVQKAGADHKDETDDNGEGHDEGEEGPTLNRFATSVIGAEITGMFITEQGEFFFNVQHPDANFDGEDEPGIVGAVNGLNINELPKDFASVQIPEGDDYDYTDSGDGVAEPYDSAVRTALGSYQNLARGGDLTDDEKELGAVYTPDDEFVTGKIDPDFNGFVQSSTSEDEGYLFTNWEHRPGAMSRLRLKRRGEGRWDVLRRQNVDFSSVEGTWVNCFGTVSPWGTPLTSEENYSIPDTPVWNKPDNSSVERLSDSLGWDDYNAEYPNPYRYGYIVELKDPEGEVKPDKHFAIGRSTHENAVVMPDEKTVYTTSDGTGRGFYKFIADEPGDLSEGTLYAADVDQDGVIGGDPADVSFNLSWIELGHASDDEIEEWIEDYDDITQEDYEEGENSYITQSEMDDWAKGNARDDRVAFLQCRQAAMRKGATTEFRKMEGINIRSDADAGDDYAYVAMSNTTKTMSDRKGDIQLNGDEFGAVYRMPLLEEGEGDHDYDIQSMEPVVVGGPNANICGGCPMDAQPNSASKVCQDCQFNPTKESEDGVVGRGMEQVQTVFTEENFGAEQAETTISEPDNIVVMDDGRVVIGEDTGNMGHENNMIWIYNPGDENEKPEMANNE
jgi:secreted PhoX family phosphatase